MHDSTQLLNRPNGHASVEIKDKNNDRALISVKTGADTNSICKPAAIAEKVEKGQALVTGFPEGSKSLYASPASIKAVASLRDLIRAQGQPLPKGDPEFDRHAIGMRAQTRGGNSGGPIFNTRAEVVGLLAGGMNGDTKFSAGNILTRDIVDKWLERLRRQQTNVELKK